MMTALRFVPPLLLTQMILIMIGLLIAGAAGGLDDAELARPLCFGPRARRPLLVNGTWEPIAEHDAAAATNASNCGRNCAGAFASPASGRDRRHRFVPAECALERFAPAELARLLARLGGGGVLFLGDSMTRQHYTAWTCALRDAGWLDGNATTELDFAQGDGMGAPSRITVRLPTTPGGRPWVGGQFAVVDAARSAALLPSSDPEEEGGGGWRCLVS